MHHQITIKQLLIFSISFFFSASILGQNIPDVFPTPQETSYTGNQFAPEKGKTTWKLSSDIAPDITKELQELFKNLNITIIAGIWEESKNHTIKSAPSKPEGYYLKLSGDSVVLSGYDYNGLYYALQTVKQIMPAGDQPIKIPGIEITDWPDVPFRGSVEGFYGEPWSHKDRLSQLEFYGKHKLNTYIYGPKDDPYHGFSDQWREPYPEEKAREIEELVKVAEKNHVNYVWAVHPGRDIHWTDDDEDGTIDDFEACRKKFELMYDMGVRSFAVFFDDISGEGTNAKMQAKMLNYLNQEFVNQKQDVTPLIMCPTQYNRAWSSGDYLQILGSELDQNIRIMWTGNSVCADIAKESVDWITERIQRKPFIWWNWPVSDYVRTRLLLGRVYGLDKENHGSLSGFTSNPMDKPEASKIGLFGVADYTWNMKDFDSEYTWKEGIKRLFPELSEAMITFAMHNSDQGPNTHNYRREESENVRPFIEEFMHSYSEDGDIQHDAYLEIITEFQKIKAAGAKLRKELPNSHPAFFEETKYWIYSFESLGEAGTTLLNNLRTSNESSKTRIAELNKMLGQFRQMDTYSKLQRKAGEPDPWAQGCVTGGTVLKPFVQNLFQLRASEIHTSITGEKPAAKGLSEAFFKPITNMTSLNNLQLTRDGKYIKINPILEILKLNPGDFIGIELPEGIFANYVHTILGNKEVSEYGEIQGSKNGTDWKKINTRNNEGTMQARLEEEDKIRFVRYINISDNTVALKTDLFKVDIPENSRVNNPGAMTDKMVSSYYKMPVSEESINISAPEDKQVTSVMILGDFANSTVHFVDGSSILYSKLSEGNKKIIDNITIFNQPSQSQIHEIYWPLKVE